MSNLQSSGGQPQKQPKYAPLVTGRIFSGLYTNRSPLRDGSSTRMEERYGLGHGDTMIAGANVEVSNRLTLVRRPGNPKYDTTNTWNPILAFDEFRVNKGSSDAFGTVLETIYTMVDETSTLYALSDTLSKKGVWAKSTGAGQTFMKQDGNSLYFGNGVDQKKWLTSLFQRNSSNNSTVINTNSYPLMSTYFIDPNDNIQQLVGGNLGDISAVNIANGTITVTVNLSPDNTDYPIGYQFILWGFTSGSSSDFLNGYTLTLSVPYTHGGAQPTTLVGSYLNSAPVAFSASSLNAFLVDVNDVTTLTTGNYGSITWSTQIPSAANNFNGGVTLDGNIIWKNHSVPQTGSLPTTKQVMNWGIVAPTGRLTPTVSGAEGSWQRQTYYSPAGIVVDAANNIWQVTTAGTSGGSNPFTSFATTAKAFPASGFTTVTDGGAAWKCVAQGHDSTGTYSTGSTNGPFSQWQASKGYSDGKYNSATNAYVQNYTDGSFIIQTAGGVPCVFNCNRNIVPQGSGSGPNVPVSVVFGGGSTGNVGWSVKFYSHSNAGAVDAQFGGSVGNPVFVIGGGALGAPTASAVGVSSVMWDAFNSTGASHAFDQHPMVNATISPAGETAVANFTTPWPGMPSTNFEFFQYGKIRIPVPMQVTFTIIGDDGYVFGVEAAAAATFVSATAPTVLGGIVTGTPWQGYPVLYGSNMAQPGGPIQIVINFPTAGEWGIEFDYAQKDVHNVFVVLANGQVMTPEQATTEPLFNSGSVSPSFPGFSTTLASQNTYNAVTEGGVNNPKLDFYTQVNAAPGNCLRWLNLGPVSDFSWFPNTPITLAGTEIIDTNSNLQAPYETGKSGLVQPTWQTTLYAITPDSTGSTLQWINEGPVPANADQGQISATSTQGFKYGIALVNTLDNTVSNIGKLTPGTGPVNGTGASIHFAPGNGLNIADIDPQADWVAIFRTTDNGSIPLLVPGVGNPEIYTVPLVQYLLNGYVDTTADVDLDELAQAPTAGENTPPLPGAINLTFHLGRIWFSIGNTLYYTSGSDAPVGNGVNGVAPSNFGQVPSQIKRLVPTTIGVLVMTNSDIYIVAGSGTPTNPILPPIPYEQNIGLSNYNALDINGAIIGFFTTDRQFVIFDPSSGVNYAGNPIGDQFRLNNGTVGQSWNPNNVYVAWYLNGEDMGWYVADYKNGWYRLIPTPSPEQGECWSPFATIQAVGSIQGNISAIKSVETQPGLHRLLVGPSTAGGSILNRDLNATTDGGTTGANGTTYPAYAVFGSYVLASPGQVAKVAFLTFDSVRTGSPLVLGVLMDEALPYFTGSFDIIKRWVNDPPELPASKSFYKQRFYLSEDPDKFAYCRDMQFLVQWPPEAAANELQTFAIFGAYEVEQ
jgi:hypothetical protein